MCFQARLTSFISTALLRKVARGSAVLQVVHGMAAQRTHSPSSLMQHGFLSSHVD